MQTPVAEQPVPTNQPEVPLRGWKAEYDRWVRTHYPKWAPTIMCGVGMVMPILFQEAKPYFLVIWLLIATWLDAASACWEWITTSSDGSRAWYPRPSQFWRLWCYFSQWFIRLRCGDFCEQFFFWVCVALWVACVVYIVRRLVALVPKAPPREDDNMLWSKLPYWHKNRVEDWLVSNHQEVANLTQGVLKHVRRENILHERCALCEYAAYQICPSPILLDLLTEEGNANPRSKRFHACPFKVGKESPPVHIARLIAYVHDACLYAIDYRKEIEAHQAVCKEAGVPVTNLKEAGHGNYSKWKNKGRGKLDRIRFSDDEYRRIRDLVERGRMTEAEMHVQDALEYLYGRADVQGGTIENILHRVAQDNPTYENAEYRGNRASSSRRYEKESLQKEGANGLAAVDLRAKRHVLWAEGEHWHRVEERELTLLKEAYKAKGSESLAVHRETVAGFKASTQAQSSKAAEQQLKEAPVVLSAETQTARCYPVEVRGVEVQTEPETTSPGQESSGETAPEGGNQAGIATSSNAERGGGNQAKPKAKKEKKTKESAVAGSKPSSTDDIVAAIQLPNGHLYNGFVFRGPGNGAFAVISRHWHEGGVEIDGFSSHPSTVTVIRPGKPHVCATVKRTLSDGDDRVVLELPGLEVRQVGFADPVLGEPVRARYYREGEWCDVVGQVTMVTNSGNCFYSMSTLNGCCRMPIFNKLGKIVGGHYHPGLNIPGYGLCPGAAAEKGKIPKKFEEEYRGMGFDAITETGQPKQSPDEPPVSSFRPGKLPYRIRGTRTEEQKMFPLRADIEFEWFDPQFFLMKPSTDMLEEEIAKYWEPVDCPIHDDNLRKATRAILSLEGRDASVPYVEPTRSRWEDIVEALDTTDNSAGDTDLGMSHHAMLVRLGREVAGPEVSVDEACQAGKQEMTDMLHCMYQDIINGEGAYWVDTMIRWIVLGKKDRYKAKKLKIGRSVQAPTFVLKALWKAVFEESDDLWTYRDWLFRVGTNPDLPVPDHRVWDFKEAKACLSLDESAFDRRMLKQFMHVFFYSYLPYMVPGVPPQVVEIIATVTIHSVLVLSDGRCFLKDRGNPSGFPSTLRLNCVVQLLVWCYLLAFKLDSWEDIVDFIESDVLLEICGDDSRVFCLTDRALEILDAEHGFEGWLQMWRQHLPWDVKIEGKVIYNPDDTFQRRMELTPPFVGRNIVVEGGLVWTPLWNCNRVVARPLHQEVDRAPEMQQILNDSAAMAMRTVLVWHLQGKAFCPVIQGMLDNQMISEKTQADARALVSEAYRWGWAFCERV